MIKRFKSFDTITFGELFNDVSIIKIIILSGKHEVKYFFSID